MCNNCYNKIKKEMRKININININSNEINQNGGANINYDEKAMKYKVKYMKMMETIKNKQ